MSETSTVRLLGPIRVVDGEGVREVAARRQRSLLAALAVHAGRPVSVSDLVDAVWDDDPPEQARNTLQSYVSRLRGAFGPIVEHGPGGYRLAESVATDVGEVRAIAVGLDRSPPADPDERARVALDALGRWSGPALGDLRDDLWFAGPVAELDELEAHLLDLAADALIAAGKPASAVGLIEGPAANRRSREPTHVLLVRALHAAGRTAEALRAADRYRSWLRDETGLLPGAAFTRAEREALDEPVDIPPTAPVEPPAAVELPRPTPLLGRDRDLEALIRMLEGGRIVTVTGPGGIGKTRLVAELAVAAPELRRTVVELAPVEPGGVAGALATRLGYRDEIADHRVLVELLRADPTVLVLDNGEHVISEARRLVRLLVDGCPELRVLVTSRSRLDLPDEHVLALEPLAVDGPASPAVELFLDRIRRVRPDTTLASDDATVGALCARLDGVPLAIELAASRAAVFGIGALVDRLDRPIDVLMSSTDEEGRHATLANVIEWSVGLLDEPSRRALAALGAFHGTFDVSAAEAVVAVVVDAPVAPIVGRLADASLLAPGDGDGRSRLLQMIQDFARRELDQLGLTEAVREAHAGWVASELRDVAADSSGPREVGISARLDGLRPEIDTALAWAVAHEESAAVAALVAPLAGPLLYRPDHDLVRAVHDAAVAGGAAAAPAVLAAGARAAFLLGELVEVDTLAHRVLDHPDVDPDSRHRAAHALGVVRLYQGRFEESRRWFERVVASESGAEPPLVERLDALGGLGLALCYAGDAVAAEAVIAQHRALAELIDSETYRAFATYMAAEQCLLVGDVDAATSALHEAGERAWAVGARFVWGIASTVLASILVRHRPAEEARRHLPLLIERWRLTATWPQLWTTLRLAAETLRSTGHADVALLVLAAADCDPAAPALVGDDERRVEGLRAELVSELGPGADGIAAAAGVVDRATVLDRALAALSTTGASRAQA